MAETVGLLAIEAVFSAVAAEGAAAVASTAVIGSLTVGTLVGSAILLGASVGLAMATSPALPGSGTPDPSQGTQTLKQAIPPRVFGYGIARIAGAYMFFEADAGTGDSYDVIALHHGRISSIRYIYLHDDLVTLAGSGVIGYDADAVYTIQGLDPADTRYKKLVRISFRLGESTETAFADVVSIFPTLWSSAHRGDGIASARLRCGGTDLNHYWKIYPHGLPKLSVVAELTRVYDPRDPAQSRSDPTTWTSSRNPVLQVIDLLTSSDHGFGLDWDRLVAPVQTALMAQADACDELVDRYDGTQEPRYQAGGFAYLTTDPVNVLQAILLACDGWMAEGADGTLSLVVGKYAAPDVTFTDDHIVGLSIDHGVADEEAVNQIQVVYTPAANDYREAPGQAWNETADQIERGRVRSQQVSLTWVESHSQARRLAKRQAARYLAPLRGTIQTTLYGLKAVGKRWVRVQSDVISDLADAVIEVTRLRIDLANARVTIDWTLVNPNSIDAWDALTDDVAPPPFPGKLAFLDLPTISGLVVHWTAGFAPGAGLSISFDDPLRPDIGYVVRVNYGSGSQWEMTFTTATSSGSRITLNVPNRDPDYFPTYTALPVAVAARNSVGGVGTFTSASVT